MAVTITKLKMWKNPGYTQQCLEIPPKGSKKLPAPDWTASENLRPEKDSIVSSIKLPLSYLEVYNMSYLYIEAEDGNTPANTFSAFGWITGIDEISTSKESVRIHWTPDYWRTYSDSAVYGKGTITRCNDATHKRPSNVQPRRWKVNKKERLLGTWGANKRYILVVYSESIGGATYIRYGAWQAGSTITSGGITYNTVSLEQLYSGLLDELIGISPNAIYGVFICPAPPFYFTTSIKTYNGYAWYYAVFTTSPTATSITLGATYTTDDTHKTVIVDPYGTVVWTLPWSMSINKLTAFFDMGTNSAQLMAYFTTQDNEGANFTPGATGLLAMLPLTNAPINANAWSEYAFTYAREYDKQNREIARNQQAVAGISGVGTSIIGGAVAGTMAAPGPGTIAGAVSGAVSSIFGTGLNYVTSGIFNDQLQNETDKLYSHQSANMLLPAGGAGWMDLNGDWSIVELIGDDVSVGEHTAFITNNGYNVEIAVTSAASYITTGGPLQIQNLIITGAIPPEAKTYIKNILANGVRIVENNPSGVTP